MEPHTVRLAAIRSELIIASLLVAALALVGGGALAAAGARRAAHSPVICFAAEGQGRRAAREEVRVAGCLWERNRKNL